MVQLLGNGTRAAWQFSVEIGLGFIYKCQGGAVILDLDLQFSRNKRKKSRV